MHTFILCYSLLHRFCCRSAWSVTLEPLSDLIFIQHMYCKESVNSVVGWDRGGGVQSSISREENNPSVTDTSRRKKNEVSHVFLHLNGVWISYANSFVTLQILMYLNKSNIKIPKWSLVAFWKPYGHTHTHTLQTAASLDLLYKKHYRYCPPDGAMTTFTRKSFWRIITKQSQNKI